MRRDKNEVPVPEGAKTILVVDDEAPIRDLCLRALKGYRILKAGNGAEALRTFENGGIDVIISDIRMPDMDGLSLLRRLKEMDPTLVVIMMTGYAEKEVILDALKGDADDFITKPLHLVQLRAAVQKALAKKALKEEIASLRSLDGMKSNFLSLISHKLRTPITVISLFVQELVSGGASSPSFPESLATIQEEVVHLERLISDLLVFSKLMDDEGPPRLEPCDIEGILVKGVGQVKKLIRKEKIQAEVDSERLPMLMLDREKITFALKHVLENAYKFTEEPGKVGVSVRRAGDRVLVTVEDSGRGIRQEHLPKIFEKFYQIDEDNTGQIPGFGLGLFYAKKFIQLHGGSIAVDSIPGMGTTVTVSLPASPEA